MTDVLPQQELFEKAKQHFLAGLSAMQNEQWAQAETAFGQSLALVPDRVSTLVNLSATLLKLNRLDEAAALIAKIQALDAENPEALLNEGILFFERKAFHQALARFDSLLDAHPDNAEALLNRAMTLAALDRISEAMMDLDRVIAMAPHHAPAHCARASLLCRSARWTEALSSVNEALRIHPGAAQAHLVRGNVFFGMKQFEQALTSYGQAMALRADFAEACCNRGMVRSVLCQWESAIADYTRALSINPRNVDALIRRGRAFEQSGKPAAAAADFAQAIVIDPGCSEAYVEQGNWYRKDKQLDAAIAAYQNAHRIDPLGAFVKGKLLHAKMLCCDWSGMDELCQDIDRGVQAGEKVVDPFAYQAMASSEALLASCATLFSEHWFPRQARPAPRPIARQKIHIGYLCGEFREQATSFLMARVYELHDKAKFRITAFDNGFDDGSVMRRRICNAFDEVVDISRLSDEAAVGEIQRREIDILINLNGYFGSARPNIFALRASPVQVNYLGFPGTLGAPYMDYLLADETVIPLQSRQHYLEKIVYLPHCYQANDTNRTIADRRYARDDFGLPAKAFVFCCFNGNYKITPDMFDGWMRVLQRVEDSVLWLYESNPSAVRNLRLEALRRGVASERLIFAKDMTLPEHLARHALADLFLDTLPCNAHTTASDCLWAGLPLLTRTGDTFPGRVASSLLKSLDLGELIAKSPQEYEDKAVWLAQHPDALRALRQKLASNRESSPLFDSARFTRHLEQAYGIMHQRCLGGLPPEAFAVNET